MMILENGLTEVKGISTLGKVIGVKKSGKKDFAVIYSDIKCNAAAVYTKNNVKGAPLIVTKKHLKDGKAQAVAVISGVANVCTGKKGIEDAEQIAKSVSEELDIQKEDVIVAQTGVIGEFTPMDKFEKGVKGIKYELDIYSKNVAEAIMTTDKIIKEIAVKVGNVTIGAISKGSGMIHPNMATMLCFIVTDADISSSKLNSMLKSSVNESFNMVSVDMDTSTSDMVTLMANGKAGKVDEKEFQQGLDFVCKEMAKQIAKDGEGATKLIEVNVNGAKTETDAKKLAKKVVTSNLVKSAMFGNDPNWGRLMCAIGNSGVKFDETKVEIKVNGYLIVENGIAADFDPKLVSKALDQDKVVVNIYINEGDSNATAWGCDLTYDYVKINAEYHT